MSNTNCYSCNACDFCESCYSCNACYYCHSCNSCYYSENLKMSEFQLFCYTENYGSEHSDSYQQKPYRMFNTQVTQEEYEAIKIPKLELELDSSEPYNTRYQTAFQKAWSEASKELKQQFFDLPHFDWDIFTKITGVEKVGTVADTQDIIELNGKKYKLINF